MSLFLRRVVKNPIVSKAFPVAKLYMTYPVGRDPPSLPKIDPNCDTYSMDLRYSVSAMMEMYEASRLAVSEKLRVDRDTTVFICNSVIGAMCEAKRYDQALSMFNYFFNECQTVPNMLSCNLIMKAHCDQGCVDKALELYRHIVLDGLLTPGLETYVILTKALVDAKRTDEACDIVKSMGLCYFTRGFLDIGNCKLPLREYPKAIALFKVSFMEHWFNQGKAEKAMEIYAVLQMADLLKPIVGKRVLKLLVEHGKETEAWELFGKIIGICDSESVGIMLKSTIIPFKGVVEKIIACLCEQGKMSEVEKLFADMCYDDELMSLEPDVSTYRAIIDGYVKAGRVDDAMKMFVKMKDCFIHRAT